MNKLLINEAPLIVLPSLARLIGLQESIVLQQVQYWISNPKAGVTHDGHKWVHNSYPEWAENFPFWSESYIKKIILNLEKSELLISAQFAPSPYDHTKSYRINYPKLDGLLSGGDRTQEKPSFVPYGDGLSETTTETTNTNTASDENHVHLPQDFDYICAICLEKVEANTPALPLPIEWQILSGKEKLEVPDQKAAERLDAANLIAMGTGTMSDTVKAIAWTFMVERDIIIPAEKAKAQRKVIKSMITQNVQPAHVAEAVHKLLDAGYTVVDLYSVEKTAVSLANPVPGSTGHKFLSEV